MDKNLSNLIKKRRDDTIFFFKSTSRSEDVLDYPHKLLNDIGLRTLRTIDLEDNESIDKTLTLADNHSVGIRIISSAHFSVSSKAFVSGRLQTSQWLSYKVHNFLSLIDTIRLLRPNKVFWFPHDLAEPFKQDDLYFIPLVDCVFVTSNEMESEVKCFSQNTRITGWPRIQRDLSVSEQYENVWFITFFQTIQDLWTPDQFAQEVKALIDHNIMFKFPAWTNTLQYQDAIRSLGGTCFDVNETSLKILAQSKKAIISAGSSLELEATLIGKSYIRFHFPLQVFKKSKGKPAAICNNINELLHVISHEIVTEQKKMEFYFDETAYLEEILKDNDT